MVQPRSLLTQHLFFASHIDKHFLHSQSFGPLNPYEVSTIYPHLQEGNSNPLQPASASSPHLLLI